MLSGLQLGVFFAFRQPCQSANYGHAAPPEHPLRILRRLGTYDNAITRSTIQWLQPCSKDLPPGQHLLTLFLLHLSHVTPAAAESASIATSDVAVSPHVGGRGGEDYEQRCHSHDSESSSIGHAGEMQSDAEDGEHIQRAKR